MDYKKSLLKDQTFSLNKQKGKSTIIGKDFNTTLRNENTASLKINNISVSVLAKIINTVSLELKYNKI